jgi:hypothetical protein
MIPLRPTESLKTFPTLSLALVIFWILADLVSRLWVGPRLLVLEELAFYPSHWRWISVLSIGLHHHLFGLLVTCLFTWAFTPQWLQRSGPLSLVLFSVIGVSAAYSAFAGFHSTSSAPVLGAEALLGVWLGAAMRGEIWSTKSTLVIGPGWIRVLDVPSYVLLFFWFFYLLVGNLFLSPPFSAAPMLYGIPFVAFLSGFSLESLRLLFLKWRAR